LGRCGVNLYCNGVAGREQIERALGVHKLEQRPRRSVLHAPTVSTWYRLAFRSA
jgi:hypothetical protein